jgi:hypothetical protein
VYQSPWALVQQMLTVSVLRSLLVQVSLAVQVLRRAEGVLLLPQKQV